MPRTPEQFVRSRREAWARLEDLVEKAQHDKLASLTDDEVHELGTLYRRTSADLARAQTRYSSTLAGQDMVRSLNSLVLRAYAQIHSAPPPAASASSSIFAFLTYGFPLVFRRHWKPIFISALIMFLPAFIAYMMVWTNPKDANLFISEEIVQKVQERAQKKLTTGWGANTSYKGVVESPAISAYIMTNNIRVCIMSVGLGITGGIGTSYVLVGNGMMVGSLAAVASNENVDYLFWSVILPHGIIELTAIAISGGAGFVLARALFAPGELPRRDALRIAGGDAAQLMLGVAAMLVVAGLIEGFITPSTLPPTFKMCFASLTALLLIVYFSLRPRRPKPARGRIVPARA